MLCLNACSDLKSMDRHYMYVHHMRVLSHESCLVGGSALGTSRDLVSWVWHMVGIWRWTRSRQIGSSWLQYKTTRGGGESRQEHVRSRQEERQTRNIYGGPCRKESPPRRQLQHALPSILASRRLAYFHCIGPRMQLYTFEDIFGD